MNKKIPGVYKITNTVTGDFYIGSSVDVYKRWAQHQRPSTWKLEPNKRLYQDMQKYGLDKFKFEIIVSIMPEVLRCVEQDCIELMKPTYNNYRADGQDVERYKAYLKEYRQSEKGKAHMKAYRQSEKVKAYHKAYNQSEKVKAYLKSYLSRLCNYNGETLTLNALTGRFRKAGISNPTQEARKYLI